ncbi:MAG TPA: DNA-directed RNA polymerase subunit beta [bacterium]|nr:DNA-directed RNA polymerase subunit beta [bacterium]HOL48140.1 DNA-directed RNA polymerase subunit beta [bacterium]HPQ18536.1 DNA-directed RNA polymerase subunit beta [bacterium]
MNRIEKIKYKSFSKLPNILEVPFLLEIQLNSFKEFLQEKVDPNKRVIKGLEEVLREIFPIEDYNKRMIMEYKDYEINEPVYDEFECLERGRTYAVTINIRVRLIVKKEDGKISRIIEENVFLGELPYMTERGTFVVNGSERAIVNQFQRSPGIFFDIEEEPKITYIGKIIPMYGSWLQFEIDNNDILYLRIDKRKKFPATLFLKVLNYPKNNDIVKLFYKPKTVSIKKEELLNKYLYDDLIDDETGEILFPAGKRINTAIYDKIMETGKKEIKIIEEDSDFSAIILNTLEKENYLTFQEALKFIYENLRPGNPFTIEGAQEEIHNNFFNRKRYDFSKVGRFKINQKFEENVDTEYRVLRVEDVINTINYLINLRYGKGEKDDIDNLGNRRIRLVGELIQNQFKIGITRMEKIIKERMNLQSTEEVTPHSLINVKPLASSLREFFCTSPLSQFLEQTNPLAEMTHKRRLSALGPGGLSRERAGFEVRDVHSSHYGRVCPIETPEGPNIGLIVSLTSYAKINELGFIVTPYRKVENGVVTDKIEYLDAFTERSKRIAQANAPLDDKNKFINKYVPVRYKGDFDTVENKMIDYMDVSPKQLISVSTSLIPFLENDDANRALMGSNMQRQAVPLMVPEEPIVLTGMEAKVGEDSGLCIKAKNKGEVVKVDGNEIWIDTGKVYNEDEFDETGKRIGKKGQKKIDKYKLLKYKRSNQFTCITQKPIVRLGDKVKEGQIIADGPGIKNGKLALGRNILVAFMPWEGYNFEDAIIISERLVANDVFTSIHIEKFEAAARDTKLGEEIITNEIFNVSEEILSKLDENGIVKIGTEVKAGDILVGKVTPKSSSEVTPEQKLLQSIFGEKARDVKDTSLRLKHGCEGVVIDVKVYSRENKDVLPPGVKKLVKVYVATKRKIKEGDKMAGRHGNKGIISKVVPVEDMPFLEDGTPVDIILNPLGVPSRMNIGQIFETHLGWAGLKLNTQYETPVFDGATEEEIKEELRKAGIPEDGKVDLYDGKTGEKFKQKVTVGVMYLMKLNHLADEKIHARSTGPYSLVTQQPLGGKAQFGGQRLGEMEVWALEAYGAAYILQEMLTVKSDDVFGRAKIYESIVKGIESIPAGIPESFNVLVHELEGLALRINIFDSEKKLINLKEMAKRRHESFNVLKISKLSKEEPLMLI